jgi:hypothetical protein
MLNTPFLQRVLLTGRAVAAGLGVLFLVLFGLAMVHSYDLFYRFHPALGLTFLCIVVGTGLWAGTKIFLAFAAQRVLSPPPSPEDGAVRHGDMVAYCRHLVRLLKRLGDNPALPPDQQILARQQAYDIEDTLGAHPLREDLERAITRSISTVIRPAQECLRKAADRFARDRMHAVVEDVIEPPFPVVNPSVVLYIQVIMISRIVDLYFPRASLLEYWRVMSDILRVLTSGQFLKLGQRLFAGVYVNSPPLGRAIDDLGQALTSLWLTRVVSRTAMLRCEVLGTCNVRQLMRLVDRHVPAMLAETKEGFIEDALTTLRLRIRHSAPQNISDTAGFSHTVADGIAKAVDMVVSAFVNLPPEEAVANARKTLPGTAAAGTPSTGTTPDTGRRGRPSRRSGRGSPFRVFHTFGQRIKYSVKDAGAKP